MKPMLTVDIEFMARGDAFLRHVTLRNDGTCTSVGSAADLGLGMLREERGGAERIWRVSVCPTRAARILSVKGRLTGLDMAGADALYLNGYNSWTDSTERPVAGRMRGLESIPHSVVEEYGLDGSGDYRFTRQDNAAGHQHGFGYGYLRRDELVTLFGSLNDDRGMTTIYQRLEADELLLDKEPPARAIAAGEQREILTFGLFEGPLRDATARWLALAGISARIASPLVGYSSWYRHYGDIDSEKMLTDLAEVSAVMNGCELGRCVPVFQIDDGYTKIGDWLKPDMTRFPEGMAPLAASIDAEGLLPGLWIAPFVCERESQLYAEHPEWLLRDDANQIVFCGSNWSGYYPLDLRLGEVRDYVRTVLHTATHDWGYRLLKLDFLFAACMVPHDGLNRGELMADALELVRSAVGEQVALDLCGVPIMSALGRTEYCRIGPDVGLDWDDVWWMRRMHRERVSTKRSLANTYGRAHLDGLAFRNDPDVYFLRRDVDLTEEQRAKLIEADVTCGGMLLTSDSMGAWDDEQLGVFHRALERFVARS